MGGWLLLADAISSIQSFVDVFISVYVLVIFAYIITSWVRLPYSPWLNRVQRFLYDVCEPYLRIFRRLLPSFGPLDLSPIIAVLALFLVDRVIRALLDQLH
ncbi:MAG TPA: YggT family protein [Gaiellaceae bacterium]|jgi:YggT family protein